MNTRVVHSALISTDESFRESVKQVLGGAEHGVELSVEIAIACTEINAAQVEELRRVTLDLVLLDLERDRKSTRLNSSHTVISYAVFCLKKKRNWIRSDRP